MLMLTDSECALFRDARADPAVPHARRTVKFPILALTLAALAPCSLPAAPSSGNTARALLPPDAFSLAQPDKLASPREVQNHASSLNLAPAIPDSESTADASALADDPPPLEVKTSLLFPQSGLRVLPPQPLSKALLCIREHQPDENRFSSLPNFNLPPHDESGVAHEAAETLSENVAEQLWYDPELAETAKAGAGSDAPAPRNPRDLLSRSILKMDRDTTPEFIDGEDGEPMSPTEELQNEELPALPTHDSADTNPTEYFRR